MNLKGLVVGALLTTLSASSAPSTVDLTVGNGSIDARLNEMRAQLRMNGTYAQHGTIDSVYVVMRIFGGLGPIKARISCEHIAGAIDHGILPDPSLAPQRFSDHVDFDLGRKWVTAHRPAYELSGGYISAAQRVEATITTGGKTYEFHGRKLPSDSILQYFDRNHC
jgi:hypothetical protein